MLEPEWDRVDFKCREVHLGVKDSKGKAKGLVPLNDHALATSSAYKICHHSQLYSRGLLGFAEWTDAEIAFNQPVPQRLVRRHAGSGRLSLYLSAHAGAIHGQPMPEARIFLRELNEHATQHQFIYSHEWQPNDLVIWDNRATMHRATRYDSDQVRDLHRTTVSDSAPTLQQPL